MSHPKGECPVCQKRFQEGDDVVICPKCGAPYHRECYQKAGQCVYANKHGDGFEYKAPKGSQEVDEHEEGSSSGILCQNCKTVNAARNIFCEQCGAALHADYRAYSAGPATGNAQSPFGRPGGNQQGRAQQGYRQQGNEYQQPFALFGNANTYPPPGSLAGEIDGIPKADWATFIGNSVPNYLAKLSQQVARKTKLGFLFSPFFFSSFYFAYRKLWGWAAISLVTYFITQVPSFIQIFTLAGIISIPGLGTETLATLVTVMYYAGLVRRVLFCVFALYLYRRHAAKKMTDLKAQSDGDADYQQALRSKGGVSIAGAVIVGVIIIAASYIVAYLGGNPLMEYLYAALGLTGLAG